jgi:Family of unknown function (DUF5683)
VKFWLYIALFCISFGNLSVFSQEELKIEAKDTVSKTIDPLRPAKAAFFSALLPGAGQAYNKKYWKIPIVYGAIGTGVYSYTWNQKKYKGYRDAYKQRLLLGENSNDPYQGILSDSRLIDAQKFHQRNRDLSLLITSALYILNIVDANVDAHLQQFNVNGKLTIRPEIQQNEFTYKQNVGLTLNYNF